MEEDESIGANLLFKDSRQDDEDTALRNVKSASIELTENIINYDKVAQR